MSSELKPGFLPVDAYLRLPRDPHTYLVKKLIPVGGVALIYGQEKSGKSAIAIQLAAAISGGSEEWMGFPILRHGKVLYLQLDNPRSTWAERFQILKDNGLKYDPNGLCLADRDSIDPIPFDILKSDHFNYLKTMIHSYHNDVVAVFVDTLRESHAGDSNDDTSMRNVMVSLAAAAAPAALIVISHSRKPSQDPSAKPDLMADHRGSSYTTGKADAIIRMTKTKMYYAGRSIHEGQVKIARREFTSRHDPEIKAILFELDRDDFGPAMKKVLADASLPSLRAKARVLAEVTGIHEETCMSRLRRHVPETVLDAGDTIDPATGEVLSGTAPPAATPEVTETLSPDPHTIS